MIVEIGRPLTRAFLFRGKNRPLNEGVNKLIIERGIVMFEELLAELIDYTMMREAEEEEM